MAFQAFTKLLIKHGRTALDGLLQKGQAPLSKLPKQLPPCAPRVARLAVKPAQLQKDPPIRDWVRHYAWETLAADLRRRAAWQFTGSVRGATRTFAEGQRWLLFPAYAFVGLSLSANQTPTVNAEEVDRGFNNVTEQIKGIFGPSPKDAVGDGADYLHGDAVDDYQAGRLIARGPRVALYKVDTPKPTATELEQDAANSNNSCEILCTEGLPADIAGQCDKSAPHPQAGLAQVTGPQVSLKCKQSLPGNKTSTVTVEFSTSDGKAYQVCLQVSPESTVPVAIQNVTIDGAKLSLEMKQAPAVTGVTSEKLEELLSDAMKEDLSEPARDTPATISESFETLARKKASDTDSYVLPQYESLSESASFHRENKQKPVMKGEQSLGNCTSPSIDVISDIGTSGKGQTQGMNENIVIPPPCAGCTMGSGTKPGARAAARVLAEDGSLDSDIVIIDDTMELDLQQQVMEDPIYLDDLEDDPLQDLTFLDEDEALTYLQHGYEGGYLLMTYFPPQEEMTSLSLPDTGENLWDAYEELFLSCGSTPTKTEVPINIEPKAPALTATSEVTNVRQSAVTEKIEGIDPSPNEPSEDLVQHTRVNTVDKVDVHHSRPPDLNTGQGVMRISEYHDAVVVADCCAVTPELITPVVVEKKADAEFNWENREPTGRVLEAHPNVAQLPSHLQGVLPLRSEAFDNTKLLTNSQKYATTLSDHLTTHTPSLLESVVLFTQLADAVAHLDKHGLVFRALTSEDILLGGDVKWNPLLLADFGERLYDKGSPRHLTYRDAVVNCAGNCSVVQPEVIPQESEPGYSDSASILRSLAILGLEVFGCRSPLAADDPFYMDKDLQFPSSIPAIFQHLLRGMMKPDAYKVYDAKIVSNCMHLLLWCPQRYFDSEDPIKAKFLVTRWLTTFSAMTLLKRSSQAKVTAQDEVKLQMKCLFLSTLDPQKLSSALDLILAHSK